MSNIKSPLTYYGGKSNIADWIVSKFPLNYKDLHYIEPFAGGLSVLFKKERSYLESVNDLSQDVWNFWRVLKDPELSQELMQKLSFFIYHENEYEIHRDKVKEEFTGSPVDRAYSFWVANQLAFASVIGGGFAYSTRVCGKGQQKNLNKIKMMSEIHNRIKRVQFFCRDALSVIKTLDSDKAFFYLDPPYPTTDQKPYKNKFTENDFNNLLSVLIELKGLFALSFYDFDGSNIPKNFNIVKKRTLNTVITKHSHLAEKGLNLREETLITNYKLGNNQMSLFKEV